VVGVVVVVSLVGLSACSAKMSSNSVVVVASVVVVGAWLVGASVVVVVASVVAVGTVVVVASVADMATKQSHNQTRNSLPPKEERADDRERGANQESPAENSSEVQQLESMTDNQNDDENEIDLDGDEVLANRAKKRNSTDILSMITTIRMGSFAIINVIFEVCLVQQTSNYKDRLLVHPHMTQLRKI
jgi:hypothetical protein